MEAGASPPPTPHFTLFPRSRESYFSLDLVFGPYYLGAWHRLPSRRLSKLLIFLFSYGVLPGVLSCLPFPLHHQTEPWLQLLLLLPKAKEKKALHTLIFGNFFLIEIQNREIYNGLQSFQQRVISLTSCSLTS